MSKKPENDDAAGDEVNPAPAADNARLLSRRRALKAATAIVGGLIGAVMAIPVVRYVLFPVGKKVVSEGSEAIDVLAVDELATGGVPVKVQLVAAGVRNAWSVADDVAVGSAWVRRDENGAIVALSAVCPHLGCAIDYDSAAHQFACPCHKSSFALSGEKQSGPAKRGLDPLPVETADGRIRLRFVRYKQDIAEREKV